MSLPRCITDLPDSADEIAEVLKAKGIKGRQFFAHCCPIAKLVCSEIPNIHYLGVSGSDIEYTVELHGEPIYGKTPKAVEEFINKFDKGEYPDLTEGNVIILQKNKEAS